MNAATSAGTGYITAGEGRVLALIPGMEGAKEFWRFQVEGLSGSFRVIAFDYPRRKPSLSTTIADYSAHFLGIMDSLGIDRAVLVGESLGGMISQDIVLDHPERVEGLILCNTVDNPRRFRFGMNMFTFATLVHQLAFLPLWSANQRLAIFDWVGKHRGFVLDPSPGNRALSEYLIEYGTACGAGGYLDRMIAASGASFTDRLREISVPTLYLRGTEDRLVEAGVATEIAGRIEGAEIALVEGGGHCCQYSRPERTNRAVLDWLSRSGF